MAKFDTSILGRDKKSIEGLMKGARNVEALASTLKVLGDPLRLAIVLLLQESGKDGMNVGALQDETGGSQPTVSHALGILRMNGIVESRRAGVLIYYRMRDDCGLGVSVRGFGVKMQIGGKGGGR